MKTSSNVKTFIFWLIAASFSMTIFVGLYQLL